MKYDLIVFDWDGTLYDSAAYIVDCVQHAASLASLKVPDANLIRDNIGLSSKEAMKYLFPGITPMELEALTKAYQEALSGKHPPTLFPGSVDVIKTLHEKGYLLAIATGKGRAGLDRDLAQLALADYFAATRCADESFSKPHPQMMLDILDRLSVEPQKTLMVGDTEYDMDLAKNAKTDALAVSYGVHHISRLKGEHVIGEIHAIQELLNFV